MSSKVVDVPEVEVEVSKLVNRMLHLCQGYRQVQMRFLTGELNLMSFGRLFELVRQIEAKHVEELIRFQVSRGQKITWYDVKPVDDIEGAKPGEIIQTILTLEKEIHQITTRLCKLAADKLDLALTTFLEDRVILRQVKVIRKRSNQLRDMLRSGDDVTPLLTSILNARREVDKLERRLRLESSRREWRRGESDEGEEIKMIGSTTRF
uniref:Ferritin n=1 Tax=Schmidtea mediterranea TaxID=79327 RepID=A0AA51NHW7_SCHMD|nr:ferritin C [Schmidtea mediterranea]